MYICEFCNKKIKNSGALSSHIRACKENPNRNPWKRMAWNKNKKGVQRPWNKGLTKENDLRLLKVSKKQKGKKLGSFKHHTEETKKNLSLIAKKRGLGGYKEGSGRGKKGKYKNIYCDSSWELAFLLYCEDFNLDVKRCNEKFEYIYLGKKRFYIPDFIVNGVYIEIKGYVTEQWKAKLRYFPYKIEVFYKKEMQPILNYVKFKYGNYLELYD